MQLAYIMLVYTQYAYLFTLKVQTGNFQLTPQQPDMDLNKVCIVKGVKVTPYH